MLDVYSWGKTEGRRRRMGGMVQGRTRGRNQERRMRGRVERKNREMDGNSGGMKEGYCCNMERRGGKDEMNRRLK